MHISLHECLYIHAIMKLVSLGKIASTKIDSGFLIYKWQRQSDFCKNVSC